MAGAAHRPPASRPASPAADSRALLPSVPLIFRSTFRGECCDAFRDRFMRISPVSRALTSQARRPKKAVTRDYDEVADADHSFAVNLPGPAHNARQ